MNPQDKIIRKIEFYRGTGELDKVDKLEQRLRDLNNMGRRQRRRGNKVAYTANESKVERDC
jgi:hypothetical protein